MTITFEEACGIIGAQTQPGEHVQGYGLDLGDAWMPVTAWDDPLEEPVGAVLSVRKSDGVVLLEPTNPGARIFDAPKVGVWPEYQSADE